MAHPFTVKPKEIKQIVMHLFDNRHNPNEYWTTFVGLVHDLFIVARDEHREECILPSNCQTCWNHALHDVAFRGESLIQADGCSCPDHRVFPHLPLDDPNLN